MSNMENERPKTTYWTIVKSPLFKIATIAVGLYAVWAFWMDVLMVVHLYVFEIWFYVGHLQGIEPWMIPLDMALWAFVLYKVVGYGK